MKTINDIKDVPHHNQVGLLSMQKTNVEMTTDDKD